MSGGRIHVRRRMHVRRGIHVRRRIHVTRQDGQNTQAYVTLCIC